MMRRLALVAGAAGIACLPHLLPSDLSAQSGSSVVSAPAASTPPSSAKRPEPARDGATPSGFGLSGEVRVILARPGALMDPGPLSRLGDGWLGDLSWTHADPPPGPRLLGVASEPESRRPARSTYLSATRAEALEAPRSPGIWEIENGLGERVTVITQVPASNARGGRLNGYHIGVYPTAGSGRTDEYAPPEAFVEVTPENRHLPVSTHLTLGQFLTKDQFDVWPKYVALDLRLIDKLELVIQELRAMGVRADRIHVMSGYRTPQYNGPGGDGRAALSRHMWGDAADVWIDGSGDGEMDDLNGDGRIDIDDAAVIMRAVERVEARHPELVGGAGTYPNAPGRGPYIHIDARGHRSRW
jgi:uncharacterized protein YcbK (DUF882 family)